MGLDVALSVAKVLGLPTPEDSPLMRLVAQKKLGKKSGEGFYKWVGGKPQKMEITADPRSWKSLAAIW